MYIATVNWECQELYNNTVQGCVLIASFSLPVRAKEKTLFLLYKTTQNRRATQRITEDFHGQKEKTEPSLFTACVFQKSEGKTAAAPVSTDAVLITFHSYGSK